MPIVEFKSNLNDRQFSKFATFLAWLKKDRESKVVDHRIVEFLNLSLKEQRYQANMSRKQAAEASGLTRSDVGKAEGPRGNSRYISEQSKLQDIYYKACGFPDLN